MTLLINISAFVFFLVFLHVFVKNSFKVTFLYGLLVFQGISIIPSLIFIEEGNYISEQGRDGFFVGATILYVLYFIFTFVVILATFNSLNRFKIKTPKFVFQHRQMDMKIVVFIAIISLIVLIYNASQSRLPIFDASVSRFSYWTNSKYPFLNKIFGNISIFIPFCLGIIFDKRKRLSVLLMIVYFGYNFCIGQKFSPIVSGLFSFFLPIVLASDYRINLKKFLNKKILISLISIFSVAYFVIYKRYEQKSPYAIIKIYDPNEAIFYRAFGLQGHLMWGATETYVYNSDERTYNFSDLSYGMHNLMYKFATSQKNLEDLLKGGFSFTNGYPSALLMTYPVWLALIVHAFLTIFILALMGWLLYKFVENKAYVLAVVAYQLFNWTIYAFTMGYFYKLKYTLIFFLCFGIWVFLNYVVKTQKETLNQIE